MKTPESQRREEENYHATVNWLQGLAPGAEVRWADDHATEQMPYCRGWVDVLVPELQEILGWGWVWTISEPDEAIEAHDRWWGLRVVTDLALWELHLEAAHVVVDRDPRQLRVTDLPRSAVTAIGLAPTTSVASLPWRPGRGWRPSTVSDALTQWARKHSGRRDITFRWDPSVENPAAPMLVALAEAAEKESYLVAESQDGREVRVGGPMMDFLLNMDPDDAAEITAVLSDLAEVQPWDDIMTDPDRIPAVLHEITDIWQKRPDMRLMQLLGNCFPASHDPFYVEDKDLVQRLKTVHGDDPSTTPGLPPVRLADVIAYAARMHAFQVDKAGEPYIGHVMRVWHSVWREGGSRSADGRAPPRRHRGSTS